MNWRNTAESFGLGNRLFHWLTSIIVICLIVVGIWMDSLANDDPFKFKVYGLHKSFGLFVLGITALRIAWLLSGNPRPYILGNPKAWEKFLAHGVHALLYVALIGMPLSGWIMTSAKDFSVSFFGLFVLPDLVEPNENTAKLARATHGYLAWMLIGALCLHIAGVIKHTVINKDGTLRRMLTGKAALALLLLAPLAAQAQTEESNPNWVAMPGSSITFEARQMAAPFEGEFKNFTADIFFYPEKLEESSVRAEIDLTSISTKSAERNENLVKPEWFDTAKFPTAVFTSKQFRQVRADPYNYEVDGTLTIKNISKDITLPFSLKIEGDKAEMLGDLTLNRLDFGLGAEGDWRDPSVVGHDVHVTIRILAECGC